MIEVFVTCLCGANATTVRQVEEYALENKMPIRIHKTRGNGSDSTAGYVRRLEYNVLAGFDRNANIVVFNGKIFKLKEWNEVIHELSR